MENFRSRKRNRLDNFGYSKNGCYYVTICTQNRDHIFGEIINNEMVLNRYGEIAKYSWLDILNHHGKIELDEFIIMPNHIHGIIFIHDNWFI